MRHTSSALCNKSHTFAETQVSWIFHIFAQLYYIGWLVKPYCNRDRGVGRGGGRGGTCPPSPIFLNSKDLVRKSVLCPPPPNIESLMVPPLPSPNLKVAPRSLCKQSRTRWVNFVIESSAKTVPQNTLLIRLRKSVLLQHKCTTSDTLFKISTISGLVSRTIGSTAILSLFRTHSKISIFFVVVCDHQNL